VHIVKTDIGVFSVTRHVRTAKHVIDIRRTIVYLAALGIGADTVITQRHVSSSLTEVTIAGDASLVSGVSNARASVVIIVRQVVTSALGSVKFAKGDSGESFVRAAVTSIVKVTIALNGMDFVLGALKESGTSTATRRVLKIVVNVILKLASV